MVENLTSTTCDLKWTAPQDDGGSPIINYVIERKTPKDTKWTVVNVNVTVDRTEFNVTGLKPETEYIFRVSAVNKAGQGKPSEPSDLAKYGKSESMILISIRGYFYFCVPTLLLD